ncbi:MAG: hypothetical protein DWH78_13530 [Planctomycetota bacterium]|nr:MAG: hypothetical protein DWH78_13530 [Planctomycetota bacterium]
MLTVFRLTVRNNELVLAPSNKAAHGRSGDLLLPVSHQSSLVEEAHSGFADQANYDATQNPFDECCTPVSEWRIPALQ